MKKILFLIPVLILFTGCNSYVELNDLGIIHTIGLEKENNSYKLYASIIEEVKEDGSPISKFYQIEGNTIFEIMDHLSLNLSKKIYLSHLDLLVLNDTIKSKEMKDIINFFLNNNESRNDFLVVTTKNIPSILKKSHWQEINNLVEMNEKETSKTIYTTMYDVVNNYYEGKPIYLTNINYNNTIHIDGIIKLEHNKQEFIEEDKAIFINYLINNIESYKINFNCSENKNLYLNILTSNTNTFNKKIFITNEIKVITNDCNLKKDKINVFINSYLEEHLKEFTKNSITIKNTIRSVNETH